MANKIPRLIIDISDNLECNETQIKIVELCQLHSKNSFLPPPQKLERSVILPVVVKV